MLVLPVAAPFKEYAQQVAQRLWDAGLYAEADTSDSTLNKRIRNAEMAQVCVPSRPGIGDALRHPGLTHCSCVLLPTVELYSGRW